MSPQRGNTDKMEMIKQKNNLNVKGQESLTPRGSSDNSEFPKCPQKNRKNNWKAKEKAQRIQTNLQPIRINK